MTKPNETSSPSAQPTTPNPSRRRLFKGVAGGTGVLLSVHAKTALGTTICKSPSQIFSGNTSPRPDTGISCSGGLSPGYWVQPQHFEAWRRAGATPPKFSPAIVECANPGVGGLALAAIDSSVYTTSFAEIFGNSPAPKNGVQVPLPVPMWAIIYSPNSFDGPAQLARHLACAWLNANLFLGTSAQYPLTPKQVKDMWTATYLPGGTYCPSGTTCAEPWDADAVIAYIKGMYDFNAEVPNYCQISGG